MLTKVSTLKELAKPKNQKTRTAATVVLGKARLAYIDYHIQHWYEAGIFTLELAKSLDAHAFMLDVVNEYNNYADQPVCYDTGRDWNTADIYATSLSIIEAKAKQAKRQNPKWE